MPTPKDDERIDAFRRFVNWLGKDADASALLDMDPRAVKRLRTIKPAPPTLLEQCARHADDRGNATLAARLFDAAKPADPIRSMTGGGRLIYLEDGVLHEVDLSQSDLIGGHDA